MHQAPLSRKAILITRARQQQQSLAERVRRHGGVPFSLPCLELMPLLPNIRRAVKHMTAGDDVLFSSANGVHCFSRAINRLPRTVLAGMRVAAIGDKTAEALRQMDVEPSLVANPASQQGMIECYRRHGLPQRLFFFRAETGGDTLPRFLIEQGVDVQLIHAYRMRCPIGDCTAIRGMLEHGEIDAVLLGSAQTARYYVRRIGDVKLADKPVVAVLSPQVAEAAKAAGLSVQVIAEHASFDALLDALAEYFAKEK
ncbi:MAG: uroporphyrinogen-III synthase [Zetaproteobacteria bacterium]|nr:MAG: uroporphyrinogen-III synthase [Zetaproteobacteria bacterium]